MRTAGQGQAAVPRERVRRRRGDEPAWAVPPGPREKIPRTVTDQVERYPEVPGPPLGMSGITMERVSAHHGFVLRTEPCVGLPTNEEEYI